MTRQESGLLVAWSLVSQNSSNAYSLNGSWLATGDDLVSDTYDRVTLQTTSGAKSTSTQFSNLSVTYTAIPEPATSAILGLGGAVVACGMLRRSLKEV